jgi:hypothetical protein
MPPRIDPYATKTHRRIDIALVVITLVLMAFAFRISARQRANDNNNRAQQSSLTQAPNEAVAKK